MKTNSIFHSSFFYLRVLLGFALCSVGVLLALVGLSKSVAGAVRHETTAQTSWIELAPTGGPPRPRALHVAVYDPATNRMTIHGGSDGTSNALSDAWVLTNADGTESSSPTWTKLLPANPLKRYGHSAVYDSSSNRNRCLARPIASASPSSLIQPSRDVALTPS